MINPTTNHLARSGLGLICLWLVAEFILLGPASVVMTASNGEFIVPALLSERFANSTGTLWQTITSTGADKKSFTFYGAIDTFLFTVLPGWLAHALRVSSVITAAVIGAYALTRKTFGFGRPASLFAGAAYAVTIPGHLIAASQGYLPLVLLALTHALDHRKRAGAWVGLGVMLFVIADTTYFTQILPWIPAVMVFWFLFVDWRRDTGAWAIIAAACLILALLRLDDIQALLANAPLSAVGLLRAVPDVGETVINALTRPYFLAGPTQVACTLAFVYGLIAGSGNRRKAIGVGWALLIGVFLVPVGVAVQSVAADFLPFLKGFGVGKAAWIPTIILPFAAGFGIEALCRPIAGGDGRRRWQLPASGRWLSLALAVAVLGFVSMKAKYVHLYSWVTNGSYARNFESPAIGEFAATVRGLSMPVRVESFQIIPNYLQAYGLETAGGYQALHSRRYYEFWARMVEPWAATVRPGTVFHSRFRAHPDNPDLRLAFRADHLWLYPAIYRPEWRLGDLYHLNLLSLANVGYLLSRDRLSDSSLEPVREIPRPWSARSTREKVVANIEANFRGLEDFYIYRNADVLPRFFTVSGISVFDDGSSLLDAMAKAPASKLRRTLFVSRADLPAGMAPNRVFSSREVRLVHYGKDEIQLSIDGEGDAFLVVTNSYSPFWQVEIDGEAGVIVPAYHTFWGVPIPASARSVVFTYRPPYK